MSNFQDEQNLVAKAVAGDQLALGQLLLAHAPRLSRFLSLKLPASARGTLGIEDILQQTFMRAFGGIDQLKQPTPRSFSAWLRRIAETQLLNALEAQQRKKRGGEYHQVRGPADSRSSSMVELLELVSDGGGTPSQAIARREAVHALQVGIASLPRDQQQAVRLHLIEGRTVGETAAAMDRTPGSVSALVHRAKENLRKALGRASKWLSTR